MNKMFKFLICTTIVAIFALSLSAQNKNADTKQKAEQKAEVKAEQKLKKQSQEAPVQRAEAQARTAALSPTEPVLQFEKTLVQYTPFAALMNKFYVGDMDIATLEKYGNFGFGVFNNLNGLMIAYNGTFYKIEEGGKMTKAEPQNRLPFALITTFRPQISMMIPADEGKHFVMERLQESLPSTNCPVAILIDGKFAKVSTRSLAKKKNLTESLDKVFEASQDTREFIDVFGQVIGFYIPPNMASSLPRGWHFYFANEFNDGGGQLIDFVAGKLTMRADMLTRHYLIMPQNEAFYKNDFKEFLKKSPSIYTDN